jgi:hypothetical protein
VTRRRYSEADLYSLTERVEIRSLELLQAAPLEIWTAGCAWYFHANQQARKLHSDPRVGAEIIAALSPQTSWEQNLRDANAVLAGDESHSTAFRVNVVKVWDILDGARLRDLCRFAPKTIAFAHNIQYPRGCSCECVTIDRHMCRAFDLPTRHLEYVGVYEAVSRGVRLAARAHGLVPSHAQAILWLLIRE